MLFSEEFPMWWVLPCTVAHCIVPHLKCLTTSLPDTVSPGTKDESPSATRSDFMITWQGCVCVCVCLCIWKWEEMCEGCACQKAVVKRWNATAEPNRNETQHLMCWKYWRKSFLYAAEKNFLIIHYSENRINQIGVDSESTTDDTKSDNKNRNSRKQFFMKWCFSSVHFNSATTFIPSGAIKNIALP